MNQSFYRGVKQGSERLRDLPKITQLELISVLMPLATKPPSPKALILSCLDDFRRFPYLAEPQVHHLLMGVLTSHVHRLRPQAWMHFVK